MTLTALGAMSGTSLDGVDAAVVLTDGTMIERFGPTGYRPYSAAERQALRAALGRWSGAEVDRAAEVVTAAHAELLGGLVAAPSTRHRIPGEIAPVHPLHDAVAPDLVGLHGQTLAHAPDQGRTLQVGDGVALARALGCPVAWDFRSADVAAGGEGAPLAPLFHHAAARWAGLRGAVAVLNLGGVGNLTWLDADAEAEAPGAILAFDTGPANAPIDDLVAVRTGGARDEGGALAAAGRADEKVMARFLADPYLRRAAPKSLDRDDFPWLAAAIEPLSTEDAAATLVGVAAAGVAAGLGLCPARPRRVLVTGGGRLNPSLMAALADRSGVAFEPVESVGLDGDMLEAQAFAYLAVRVLHGLPISLPGTTGAPRPLAGGRIARP